MKLLIGTFTTQVNSWVSSSRLGSFVDVVQLQTAQEQTQGGGLIGGLTSVVPQLAIGKQVNDRLFISLTSGLCRQQGEFFSNIGYKAEYQLGRTAQSGFSLSYEPGFDKLVCGEVDPLSTSKRQFGLDLFRTWRR
jgi:hypothetical protein